jgi:hypothetical protein
MPSGFQYETKNNSLVILNTNTSDIVYIKIGEAKTLKKILFSKTDNNQGSFKAFNFVNGAGEISFSKLKQTFFKVTHLYIIKCLEQSQITQIYMII